MSKILFIGLLFLVVIPFAWSDEPPRTGADGEAATEIRLVDGTVLIVKSIREVGKQFIFTLENGSMVAFQHEDVDPTTLPGGLGVEPSSFVAPSTLSIEPSRPNQSESLGARKLHYDDPEQKSGGIVIQITGDGSSPQAAPPSSYDETRRKTLEQLESLAEQHSTNAAELTTKMREYVNGCYGSTETSHKTETTGIGITTGTIDSTPEGAWVGGNSGGEAHWGAYTGSSQSDFQAQTFWSQESHTTSTTYNSDTPYCMSLFGEIKAIYNVIGPTFEAAIRNARLCWVLDSETNAIFTKHGIATTDVWMLGR